MLFFCRSLTECGFPPASAVPPPGLDEGVPVALTVDDGRKAVARIDDSVVGKDEELLADRRHHRPVAAAWEICLSDIELKEAVAAEDDAFAVKGDAARRVSGDMEDREAELADLDDVAVREEPIRGRRRLAGDIQHTTDPLGHPLDIRVSAFKLVQGERRARLLPDGLHRAHVIGVAMRRNHNDRLQIQFGQGGQYRFRLRSGIDDHGLPRGLGAGDVTV